MPIRKTTKTPSKKRPRSREQWGAWTNATVEEKVEAMLSFVSSTHARLVLSFLEEQSYAGQNPFDAAKYDPYKAAGIGGRQDLLVILEEQIEQAKRWKPKPQPQPKQA